MAVHRAGLLLSAREKQTVSDVYHLTMADLELDSFYVKFKNLVYSGKDANLTIKSEAGKVSVILSLDLGPVHHGRHGHLSPQRSRNGLSRQRRREKRAADRAVKEHEELQDQELAEEATGTT